MEIVYKHFNIIPDNEMNYFAQLKGVLESVDEYSSMQITRTPSHYLFRLTPSTPSYTNNIIEELNKYHNLLNIRVKFSKSIKTTSVINFKIKLQE